ncbi:hypothetical protein FRC19_008815 [Serendipita sp. 401]|nr:hypothetical protein FRC19_008815 [Serendipita sp. 401]
MTAKRNGTYITASANRSNGVCPGGLFMIASAWYVTSSTHRRNGEYSIQSGNEELGPSVLDCRAKVLLYAGEARAKLLARKYWITFSSLIVVGFGFGFGFGFSDDDIDDVILGSNVDGQAGTTWHQVTYEIKSGNIDSLSPIA